MRTLFILLSRINRMWILLAVAVILGVAATWVTTQYLKVREQHIEAEAKKRVSGGATVSVVVPVKNLAKGTVVDTGAMAARDVLADLVYDGDTILADDFNKFQGMKLAHPVQKGRPLRMSDIDMRAKEFSEILQEGTRAITIDVDEINSVAQMVRPGNHVDLMLIMTDPNDPAGGQQVVSLLQKVNVLATGQVLSKAPERDAPAQGSGAPQAQRYSNVTLEVTPDEAARIALAQQLGKIRAVLRNEDDNGMEQIGKVNTQTLLQSAFGGKKSDARPTVEFIIGGKGGGGVGTTVNVNMAPAVGALAPAAPNAAPTPAAALAPGTGQINVPGVGNVPFGVPFSPSPAAPATTPRY